MKIPKTFLVGYTASNIDGINRYLSYTKQDDFREDWKEAQKDGLSETECLISMFAKLCYKSLVLGKNDNITKTRSIRENLKGCIHSGHGSVFEHAWLNFVTTDCSRVFTHELVRHRVGTAFSQTSGRYCAIDDDLDIVFPDALRSNDIDTLLEEAKVKIVTIAKELQKRLIPDDASFSLKKSLTSAIRRIAPNGQTNEIAWSCNLRALRHMIEMRTSRHAEWEIRLIFNQVAILVKDYWPMILYGAKEEGIDGLIEYSNLKV